jgi:hypothetical protein
MILACADGGLLCVPVLVACAGGVVAWIKMKTVRKPEPDKGR